MRINGNKPKYRNILQLIVVILLPFSGWLNLKNKKLLACIATYFTLFFILLTLTRWITHPIGLIAILAHILVALLLAPVVAYTSTPGPKPGYFRHVLFSTIVLFTFWVVITNREDTVGVNIFFIPSESMAPTLLPGDIILVDSWHYLTHPVVQGEIVVFNAPYAQITMVKRVMEVQKQSFSVASDNRENTLTNSRLDGIATSNLRGKARFVLVNISGAGTNDRLFKILD